MIDMCEDLVQNLQELSKDAPTIIKLYSSFQVELKEQRASLQTAINNAKLEINNAELSGTKKITDLSNNRKKRIDSCLKELEETVEKAEALKETLDISIDSIQDFKERIDDFEYEIKSLKKEFKKQTSLCKKLEERVSSVEENMNNKESDVEIDYDEVLPAVEIYNKYIESGIPIIIEKPTYKNDYCFKVNGTDDGARRFTGNYYRAGKIYKRNSTFPYDVDCRMYHGDTTNILLEECLELLKK